MKAPNELKAGIFIFASLALLAMLIFVMGKDRQIFADQAEYYTTFRDVKGLAVGAPIRLGGITIGRIARVGFSDDLNDMRVHVSLLINEEYLDRLRSDSMVMIETQGLLGDRFITVSAGASNDKLKPRSGLPSMEPTDFSQIIPRAQAAVDNTADITLRLNQALDGLKPETIAAFGDAAASLSKIFNAVNTEKGFVHRLVYDEKEGARLLESLAKTSADISGLVAEARTGKGLLHALIYDEETAKTLGQAAKGVARATEEVGSVLAAARDGKGLVHDLIYTEVEPGAVAAKIERIMTSLDETAKNLKVASDALASGTGTLGALILDPKVYDSLVEITDGAERSFLLRQAIRSSLKK
jgi:phospholipid/cholesterol/gamma-HCH transport system substrate-binding protein